MNAPWPNRASHPVRNPVELHRLSLRESVTVARAHERTRLRTISDQEGVGRSDAFPRSATTEKGRGLRGAEEPPRASAALPGHRRHDAQQ